MSVYLILLIMLGTIVLESTIINRFLIFGVVPNIILILVIIIALSRGFKLGSFIGLVSGLIIDILFAPVIGVNGLIYFFVGFLVGLLEQKFSKDNILIPVIMTVLFTMFYHFLYLFFMFFLNYTISIDKVFRNKIIIEILYNSILMIPIYKMLSKHIVLKGMSFSKK